VSCEAEEEADTAVVSVTTTTKQIACLSVAQQSMGLPDTL